MPTHNAPLLIYQDLPVEAIVGREPNWIIRSGISLIASLLVMMLILSSLIQYPNVLQSQIKITPDVPPAQLVSKISGRVQELYINDGDEVKQGQPLLLIENNVDQIEFAYLESFIVQYNQLTQPIEAKALNALKMKTLSNLGNLQPEFEIWHQQFNQLALNLKSKESKEKIAQLTQQSDQAKSLKKSLINKKLNWEKLIDNQKLAIDNHTLLAKGGVVSEASLLPLKNEYLIQQVALDDLKIEIARNEANQKDYLQQVEILMAQLEDSEQQLIHDIDLTAANLRNAIRNWKHQYLLTSPVSGVVSMAKFLTENQQTESGQTLIHVAVENSGMRGELIVPHKGAGKLKIGQQVNVELDSFPANEYGKLVGIVSSISEVQTQSEQLLYHY